MRVLLDTNVIVSAVTTRGLCADVFRTVLADHELVTCPKVLQEIKRILQHKFSVPDSLRPETGLSRRASSRLPIPIHLIYRGGQVTVNQWLYPSLEVMVEK